MRINLLAPALGITLSLAVGIVRVYGGNWTLLSRLSQDETWTVIEYPDGQEVVVELRPAVSTDAKGTARVKRSGGETTISLDVTGVTGDESTHQVYVVDSLGNATLLGTLTITDGSGSLSANTALSKFMIVISPEANLTTIVPDTKVVLRSTVPSGFAVVPKEKSGETEKAAPASSNTQMQPAANETPAAVLPAYDVPLLGIGSLKRGANTTVKANFSSGYQGTRASVVVKPQENGPTLIKMRFTNLKEVPEGTQYLVWQATPDNSYTLLGHLTQAAKTRESVIEAETPLSDFGLFITFENADATTPTGSLVATIIK